MSSRRPRSYAAYLQSSEWRQRRERALYLAQHRCQNPLCQMAALRAYSDADLAWMKNEVLHPNAYRLEVHHLTYERIGREHDDDLIVLCPQCHADVHGIEHTDEPFTKSMCTALAGAISLMVRAIDEPPDA